MWFCSKLWSWVHRLHKRSPRELFAFLSCLTKTLDLQHSKRNNFPKVPRYLAYFFLIAGIIVVRVVYTQCEGLLEQTQRLYRGSYNNDTDFCARESTHLMWISLQCTVLSPLFRWWPEPVFHGASYISTFLAILTADIQFPTIFTSCLSPF